MAEAGRFPPHWVVAPGDGWVAPRGRTPDGRVLATVGRRVRAFLLDVAIWLVPQMILVLALVVALLPLFALGPEEEPPPASIVAVVVIYLLMFGVGILQVAVAAELVARRGQTWGMRALGLRVVDGRTGGPVSRGRAWGRAAFAAFLSGQAFGIGYWWSFFDDRNRTLHDLVSSTVVVDERA